MARRGISPARPASRFRHTAQDGIDDLDQYTQEIRLASAGDRPAVLAGRASYYFRLQVPGHDRPVLRAATTAVEHKNTAWAAFGSR